MKKQINIGVADAATAEADVDTFFDEILALAAVDPEQLNAIAASGGTSYTTYLDAQDETQLAEALTPISATARL